MRCILIGGCDRSGTTMLGSMLGGAEGAVCTPESQFKFELLRKYERSAYDPEAAVEELLSSYKFLVWEFQPSIPELHAAARQGPGALLSELVRQFSLERQGIEPHVWVDHTPGNIRHALLLHRHFPDSHFVHIVRDGRAVAASLLPQTWGATTIEQAAAHWQLEVGTALAVEQIPQLRIVRCRYEDIVSSPDSELEGLARQLGLPSSSRLVEGKGFVQKPRAVRDTHTLVGRPPDPSRIDAWRGELSERDVEVFEALAQPMLATLGYSMDYGLGARRPSAFEHRAMEVRGLVRRVHKLARRERDRWVALRAHSMTRTRR